MIGKNSYDIFLKCDELYKNLVNGELDPNDVIVDMRRDRAIMEYIEKCCSVNSYCDVDDNDVLAISSIIKILQYVYNYSGIDTGISDSDYDVLYEIMVTNGGKEIVSVSPSTITQSCHHKFPSFRGTLDKVYLLGVEDEETVNKSRRSLDQWIQSSENDYYSKTGERIDLSKVAIEVFPKFDGVSCIFEIGEDHKIQRALTRGYTSNNTAQNVIAMFPKFKYRTSLNLSGTFALKTEIMVKNSDLEKFNEEYGTSYKNTRSIASAILNSNEYDISKAKLLHPIPLRVGNEDIQVVADEAFEKYPYLVTTMDDRIGIRNFANRLEEEMPEYRCDGIVIRIQNPSIQKILGRKDDRNKFEVAYKFTEVECKSIIRDIRFQLGLFGNISPVALFDPVKLKGNTISKASLGSIGRMRELKLSPGDEVIIKYDIIPYLTVNENCKKSGNENFKLIDCCPCCGERLSFVNNDSYEQQCTNPNCKSNIIGKLVNFVSKMRISGISYATINKLIDEGFVKNIPDLFTLYKYKNKLSKLDGFGKKRTDNILKSIDDHREITDVEFLGSIGIEGVSKKTFSKILTLIPYDAIMENVIDDSVSSLFMTMSSIDGIGEKTALSILDYLEKNKELFEEFNKLIVLGELNIITKDENSNNSKFTVCFTKIRDNHIEQEISRKGGKVVDSVNKDTTYLIVPDELTTSSKVTKANKYKTKIMTLESFREELSKI